MLPPVNPTRPHALIARYRLGGAISYGEVSGAFFLRLSAAPWLGGVPTGERDPADRATLLAPCEPTKIVCIGLNYIEHARESLTNAPGAGIPAEPGTNIR